MESNKRNGTAWSLLFLTLVITAVWVLPQRDATPPSITSITRIDSQNCVITLDEGKDTGGICEIYRTEKGKNQFEKIGVISGSVYYDHGLEEKLEYEYYLAGVTEFGKQIYTTDTVSTGYNARSTTNVAVLMYHYFNTEEDISNDAFEGIFVEELEADLKYFRDNGIMTITSEELLAFINGEIALPEKCVMITVDDGHYSIYEHMYPLLLEYECNAVVSLVGGFISDLSKSRDPQIPKSNWMNWDEVAEIAGSGFVEFGSHTNGMHTQDYGRYGVQMMEGERPEDYSVVLKEDMEPLNALIEKYCGYSPKVFAYPYSAPQGGYYGFMTDVLGYELLLCGNETEWSATNGNRFVYGIGVEKMEDRIIRRFGRYSGISIEELLNDIWNNAAEVAGNG